MFIYKIENIVTKKVLIGQTTRNPKKRWREHRSHLRAGIHYNPHLQNAWNKYGEKAFTFEIICETTEQLLDGMEKQFIEEYNSIKNGYNLREGGNGGKLSVETRKRMSKAHIGKKKGPMTLAQRLHLSKIKLGSTHTEAFKLLRAKKMRPIGYPIVIDPYGNEHFVENLSDFCKKHSLNRGCMWSMMEKRCQQHKGWHLPNTVIIPKGLLISMKKRGVYNETF